jgi:hypothetical protein
MMQWMLDEFNEKYPTPQALHQASIKKLGPAQRALFKDIG